jgi:hypothetical protein
MPDDYFQLTGAMDVPSRWYLGEVRDEEGNEVSPETFTIGRKAPRKSLIVSVRRHGYQLDWTFADFELPVASVSAARVLQEHAWSAIESHQVTVEGYSSKYSIINVLQVQDCLDESRSDFLKWKPEDERPDREGQYRAVNVLRIDPTRTDNLEIFRLAGWDVAVIVSERIKAAFEARQLTGARFLPVTST